ncbi:MAG: metal ABC transporter permease [Acholeplasmataceae bacterium]|nr:metal ABC transporter permease [Acholeplasmataceae bacterium]
MFSLLQYDFIIHALFIGLSLALSAALISPFLVLNQQAMIADGLAHVSFAGLVIGLLFANQPLIIAIPFVILASLLIKYLATSDKMNSDAAIGLVASVSFAIGLIVIKKSSGFHLSAESMLVGNIFTATRLDLILSLITSGLILIFILRFYRPLFLMTYDDEYAKFAKIKGKTLGYLLSLLSAVFIVIGVRTIGTLLISAFIVFPSILASQWTKSFRMTVILGVIISLVVVITGIFVAHPLEIPVGSTIVVLYAVLLLFMLAIKRLFHIKAS